MSLIVHATCVAIDGLGVLLTGPPGSGKSDLALRLIDGGAQLVADDQCRLENKDGELYARPPGSIQGLMEIRHLGLVRMTFSPVAPVALYVELTALGDAIDRLPSYPPFFLLDHPVRRLRLPAFAASTPAKIRASLKGSIVS